MQGERVGKVCDDVVKQRLIRGEIFLLVVVQIVDGGFRVLDQILASRAVGLCSKVVRRAFLRGLVCLERFFVTLQGERIGEICDDAVKQCLIRVEVFVLVVGQGVNCCLRIGDHVFTRCAVSLQRESVRGFFRRNFIRFESLFVALQSKCVRKVGDYTVDDRFVFVKSLGAIVA